MQNDSAIHFSSAALEDLSAVIALLADDELSQHRESFSHELDPRYVAAFHEILNDANNDLIVGKLDGEVIACLQITYIPNLTLHGSKRALIEGVQVSSALRGKGIGKKLFNYTLDQARKRGCRLAQLTSNKIRVDALRFYKTLGFKPSHEGFKITL